MTTVLKEVILIDIVSLISLATQVPQNFFDMNPLITIGAGAAALLSIFNLITKVATVISQNKEQIRTLQTLQDTMTTMGDQFMKMERGREESVQRLNKAENDLVALREDTDKKTSGLNQAVSDIRKDISEIKEILENQTKGDE